MRARRVTGLLVALVLASAPVPAGAVDPARAPGCQTLADFGHAPVGAFPTGWEPRDAAARTTYRVLAEGGVRFVRATAEGTGSQMGRQITWDVATRPTLAWRWRPVVFPPGDERDPARNDSALAVYAVFGTMPLQAALRAVKYVWSRSVPVGTLIPGSRTGVIVIQSGSASGGEWVSESVDVRRDYQRLFGEPPPRARGVAVLTDADQTHSRAVGDYGPIHACPASGD